MCQLVRVQYRDERLQGRARRLPGAAGLDQERAQKCAAQSRPEVARSPVALAVLVSKTARQRMVARGCRAGVVPVPAARAGPVSARPRAPPRSDAVLLLFVPCLQGRDARRD